MAPDNACITETELREAFKLSGLWRFGWNFKRAITTSNVLWGLKGIVRDQRKQLERTGRPAPIQQALI